MIMREEEKDTMPFLAPCHRLVSSTYSSPKDLASARNSALHVARCRNGAKEVMG